MTRYAIDDLDEALSTCAHLLAEARDRGLLAEDDYRNAARVKDNTSMEHKVDVALAHHRDVVRRLRADHDAEERARCCHD